MITLLELPDELICQILSKLTVYTDAKGRFSPLAPGHEHITGFALTCHRAWELSEPFLYSAVLLRQGIEVTIARKFYSHDDACGCWTCSNRGRYLKDLAV